MKTLIKYNIDKYNNW